MSQIHSTSNQILSLTLSAFLLVTLSGAFATAQAAHGSAAEVCEYHLQRAHTDGGRVVKNGLISGLFGAGIGAVGGAIGGSAGRGAGIGAGAGVAAGASVFGAQAANAAAPADGSGTKWSPLRPSRRDGWCSAAPHPDRRCRSRA